MEDYGEIYAVIFRVLLKWDEVPRPEGKYIFSLLYLSDLSFFLQNIFFHKSIYFWIVTIFHVSILQVWYNLHYILISF